MENFEGNKNIDLVIKIKLEQLSLAQGRAQHQESRNWTVFSIFLTLFSLMFGLLFLFPLNTQSSKLYFLKIFFSFFGFILSIFDILAIRRGQSAERRHIKRANNLESEIVNLIKMDDVKVEVWKIEKVNVKSCKELYSEEKDKIKVMKIPLKLLKYFKLSFSCLKLVYENLKNLSIGKLMYKICWLLFFLWILLLCFVVFKII